MKADRPVEVRVMNAWQGMIPVQVGTEWKRYDVTFNRGSAGRSFLRIALLDQGTLWLDALQLEPGDAPSDYEPAEPRNADELVAP
jgi:hypothetical protein